MHFKLQSLVRLCCKSQTEIVELISFRNEANKKLAEGYIVLFFVKCCHRDISIVMRGRKAFPGGIYEVRTVNAMSFPAKCSTKKLNGSN